MPKYDYEYYSGAESDQFRFLRIPKVFFEDSDYEDLGLAEYVLYGFLHELVDYSHKKGWVDKDGRTYVIWTVASMQKVLRCSEDKARSTLKNLVDFGLVERKRRGQGKSDILYVKNFITKKAEISGSENNNDCGKLFSETEKNGVLSAEITESGEGKFPILESADSVPKDNNINLKNIIEPNHNLIQVTGNTTGAAESVDNSGWDEDEIEELIEEIKENICYDDYAPRYKAEYNNRYEEMFQVIVEMVVGKRKSLVIGGTEYPQCIIKKRFLSLNSSHVEYAMWKIKEHLGEIRNMKKYMIATLFNAPTTIDNFYTQLVNHDMHSDAWFEMLEKRKLEEVGVDMQVEEVRAMNAGTKLRIEDDFSRRAVNE